jgi:hypothetical protein
MHRRNPVGMSVIATLALLPATALGQQRSLKDQLIGTWTIVSSENTAPNGTKSQPYGANPKGILMFDAGGRHSLIIGKPDRPKLKSANRSEVTAQEFGAAAMDFVANYGTWSVNEAGKIITVHREGALNPYNEGVDIKYSISLAGDELKLTTETPSMGGRSELVYRRAR